VAVGTAATPDRYMKTDIPARLDRPPWSRWHWTIVAAPPTAVRNGLITQEVAT
jgi:hypothetical protein